MKCSKHPNYKAKRKPRAKCKECEVIWLSKNLETAGSADLVKSLNKILKNYR